MIKLENILLGIDSAIIVLVFAIMVVFGGLFDSVSTVMFRELSYIISPYAFRGSIAIPLYYFYNVNLFLFSIIIYIRIKNKLVRIGCLYLSMSAVTSALLLLFPMDPSGTSVTITGFSHVMILLIMVFYVVMALFLFGVGFKKSKHLQNLSTYSFEISMTILFTGLLTGAFALLNMPSYVGFIQRIPILSFLLWIIITTYFITKSDKRIKYDVKRPAFLHNPFRASKRIK